MTAKKSTSLPRSKVYVPLVIIVLLAAVPSVTSNSYVLHVLIMILFYAVLSEAWSILAGFAGQFSLGHAAFFGIGAYTSTLLFIWSGVSPWVGMFIGAGLAVVLSLVIGFLCFRLRGPFFSLVTIAFAETLRLLFLNWGPLTGGPVGLLVPLSGDSLANFQFLSRIPYYYTLMAITLIVIYVTYRIRNSQLGLRFMAIREDEDAAQSLGINIIRYKLIALAISVFFTALAGTFYAQYLLFLHPDAIMSLNFSIEIALPAIIGGMGTIWGPIIGSILLTPLAEFTRSILGGGYAGVYLIIYGSILILTMMFLPNGITHAIAARNRSASRSLEAKP
jgi:branched-chain amino acid transport system permease protein